MTEKCDPTGWCSYVASDVNRDFALHLELHFDGVSVARADWSSADDFVVKFYPGADIPIPWDWLMETVESFRQEPRGGIPPESEDHE